MRFNALSSQFRTAIPNVGNEVRAPGLDRVSGSTSLPDDLPSEKAVRASVKRLRRKAARLRDRLKRSSVKIATLDEAASHPERVVSGGARPPRKG